jgi:hypothetical protein
MPSDRQPTSSTIRLLQKHTMLHTHPQPEQRGWTSDTDPELVSIASYLAVAHYTSALGDSNL